MQMQDGAAGGGAEGVEVTSQALGSWTKLYDYPNNTGALSLTPQYAIYNKSINSCATGLNELTVVYVPTALVLPIPAIDVPCATSVTAAYGGEQGVFVYDDYDDTIYKLDFINYAFQWVAIASNVPRPVNRILTSSTHVYWDEHAGISVYRVPIAGGATTRLVNGPHYSLLGIDGSYLYIERGEDVPLEAIRWHLEKQPVAGGAATVLYSTQDFRFLGGFTFDANHFYITDEIYYEGDSSRILRLTKAGASLTLIKESTTQRFRDPITNGNHLYWIEIGVDDPFGRDARINRRKISDGSSSSIYSPVDSPNLTVGAGNIWVSGDEDDWYTEELWRGQL